MKRFRIFLLVIPLAGLIISSASAGSQDVENSEEVKGPTQSPPLPSGNFTLDSPPPGGTHTMGSNENMSSHDVGEAVINKMNQPDGTTSESTNPNTTASRFLKQHSQTRPLDAPAQEMSKPPAALMGQKQMLQKIKPALKQMGTESGRKMGDAGQTGKFSGTRSKVGEPAPAFAPGN